jgi:hypothetical protein
MKLAGCREQEVRADRARLLGVVSVAVIDGRGESAPRVPIYQSQDESRHGLNCDGMVRDIGSCICISGSVAVNGIGIGNYAMCRRHY